MENIENFEKKFWCLILIYFDAELIQGSNHEKNRISRENQMIFEEVMFVGRCHWDLKIW